ncbi:bacteriophage HK97-gp10 putative tail-component [Haloactinopolyspora alba]|uniref:Bacteriophage HK97-gp10 putative tail-component n=1 Tax=Haloactinopolyspora alba TaxID=648780 RepID=A0A2P8E0E4_9ACTN|nr:HK97 gp10 family phage protein [Haloactinopolyspora alba]PSL02887.1 bacteriophage HK97-gp10 putative tail-component [Haloactinopolyspora alba]
MATEAIKVEGLSEFVKNLRTLDRELPKAVRIAFNEAADVVVDDATPRIPRRSGRAARTLKAKSTRTQARVAGGATKAPYYPWLDFGGAVGPAGSVKRPFRKKGRYLYKSYFKKRDSGEFQQVMNRSLIDVARRAGVEVD